MFLERKWGIGRINSSYHCARAFGNKGFYNCTYWYHIDEIGFQFVSLIVMSFYFSVKEFPVKPATKAWDFVSLITFSFSWNHFVIKLKAWLYSENSDSRSSFCHQ